MDQFLENGESETKQHIQPSTATEGKDPVESRVEYDNSSKEAYHNPCSQVLMLCKCALQGYNPWWYQVSRKLNFVLFCVYTTA